MKCEIHLCGLIIYRCPCHPYVFMFYHHRPPPHYHERCFLRTLAHMEWPGLTKIIFSMTFSSGALASTAPPSDVRAGAREHGISPGYIVIHLASFSSLHHAHFKDIRHQVHHTRSIPQKWSKQVRPHASSASQTTGTGWEWSLLLSPSKIEHVSIG